MMDEWHMTEAQALAALQRQAQRKRLARISVRVSDAKFGGAEIASPSK
jgi:hypothetical protein